MCMWVKFQYTSEHSTSMCKFYRPRELKICECYAYGCDISGYRKIPWLNLTPHAYHIDDRNYILSLSISTLIFILSRLNIFSCGRRKKYCQTYNVLSCPQHCKVYQYNETNVMHFSLDWESRASTCFEHYLLIIRRHYTNQIGRSR
jgi:hypothetical protein